jgi:hypothetical protein
MDINWTFGSQSGLYAKEGLKLGFAFDSTFLNQNLQFTIYWKFVRFFGS